MACSAIFQSSPVMGERSFSCAATGTTVVSRKLTIASRTSSLRESKSTAAKLSTTTARMCTCVALSNSVAKVFAMKSPPKNEASFKTCARSLTVVTLTVEMLAVYGPGASLLASPVGWPWGWSSSLCTMPLLRFCTSFFAQPEGSLLRLPAVRRIWCHEVCPGDSKMTRVMRSVAISGLSERTRSRKAKFVHSRRSLEGAASASD